MKEMDDQKENIQGKTGIMDMIKDIKLDADKKEKIVCKIIYNFLSFSFHFQKELCDNENIS